MNNDNIELYFSETTDLDVVRCEGCGSIDFEDTGTRVYCIRCGLVAKKYPYSSTGSEVKE